MSQPAVVTNFSATPGPQNGQVSLSWGQPGGNVATSRYKVFVTNNSDNSNFIVNLAGTAVDRVLGISDGLEAGINFSFIVFSISSGDVESGPSATQSATATGTIQGPISVPCYAKGTMILTDKGYIKIEDIKKGDKVAREGSISEHGVLEKNKIKEVPVTWVSKFKIKTLDLLSRPICIAKNAFGEDRPFENLYVSPGHSIMIDDRLITAKDLRNGDTIYPYNDCESVEYYHVQCETHSAIYANGVLSETYVEWNKEFFDVINYLQ